MKLLTMALFAGLLFFLLPLCLGLFWKKESALYEDLTLGFLTELALFELLAVPMILLRRSLSELTALWLAACLAFSLLSLWRCRERIREAVPARFGKKGARSFLRSFSPADLGLLALVLALLILGCFFYLWGMHVDEDDARYAANALAAYEKGSMLILHPNTGEVMPYFGGEIAKEVVSPLTMLYASVSSLLHLHPTIMMHSLWPCFFLLLGLFAHAVLGNLLFEGDRTKTLLFLVFVQLIYIYGNTSSYCVETFALTRIWQGKGLIAPIFVPLFLCYYLRTLREGRAFAGRTAMIALACSLVSGMGLIFSAFMIFLTGLSVLIQTRSIRLLPVIFGAAVPEGILFLVYLLILNGTLA